MELAISDIKPIPAQDLEGKVAHIGKIIGVYPSNIDGMVVHGTVQMATYIRIQVMNKTGFGGSSAVTYDKPNYEMILEAYRISNPDDLLGKPVVTVYTGPSGMLTGLIPLNL